MNSTSNSIIVIIFYHAVSFLMTARWQHTAAEREPSFSSGCRLTEWSCWQGRWVTITTGLLMELLPHDAHGEHLTNTL